ncbi:MAG: hypothetical protein R3C11_12060 [Planctomycetaceae bacterium]
MQNEHQKSSTTAPRKFVSMMVCGLVFTICLFSGQSAEACWFKCLFSSFYHNPCNPCGNTCYQPWSCAPGGYGVGYPYQPAYSPILPGADCGCGSSYSGMYPGAYAPAYAPMGMTSYTPQAQVGYTQPAYPMTTGSNFHTISSPGSYAIMQGNSDDYSEWTSVPATGSGNASLQGVIVEPGPKDAVLPSNRIVGDEVPTPYDQRGYNPPVYQQQSWNSDSVPTERAARARAFRERIAARKEARFYREAGTHTYGGGVQYDHRTSVKAPSAAIVWQTP